MKTNLCKRILSVALSLALCAAAVFPSGITACAETSAVFTANTFYYDQLSAAQQAVYAQLDQACSELMSSKTNYSTQAFGIVRFDALSDEDVMQVFRTFYYSNPQYYFLSPQLMYQNDLIVLSAYDFYRSDSTDTQSNIRSSLNSEFDAAAAALINSLSSAANDVAKEKAIIDAICKIPASNSAEADSVYGALLGSGCSSIGYAVTMSYLCELAQIPCITIMNDNDAAWNMVQLNGKWYLVDIASYIVSDNDGWINNSSDGFAALDPDGGHNAASNPMFSGITFPECTSNSPETTTIVGDVNGDNRLSLADVLILGRSYVADNGDIYLGAADMNGDGRISLADIMQLGRTVVAAE